MDLILSILALVAGLLLWGAWRTWARGSRRQALLMLVAAFVMAGNVALWIVPTGGGQSPLEATR